MPLLTLLRQQSTWRHESASSAMHGISKGAIKHKMPSWHKQQTHDMVSHLQVHKDSPSQLPDHLLYVNCWNASVLR